MQTRDAVTSRINESDKGAHFSQQSLHSKAVSPRPAAFFVRLDDSCALNRVDDISPLPT
jgi:hypothetical protein